jgi:hypothetical protein
MIRIITLSIILASCTSVPLDKPGISRETSMQDSVWVDPTTLEPAFDDDTIGQPKETIKHGK